MKSTLLLALFSVNLAAQASNLSARDLFFTPTPVSASTGAPSVAVAAPLGLRYSLLKSTPAGMTEVRTDSVFQSGDTIRLTVEANQNGFLYIIHQGSSGEWSVMEGSPIALERNRRSDVPSGGQFRFDDRAGEERLYLVFVRQRDASLDRFLKGGGGAELVQAPAKRSVDPVMMSSLKMQSRDLVFERVDDPPSRPKAEKAAYAVNPGTSNETRVVVDLRLQHR